jgi:hypothetical protein
LRKAGAEPPVPVALFKAIARHKVQDALRRRGRRPATNTAAELGRIDAADGDTPLGRGRPVPWTPAEYAGFRRKLLDRLAVLPPRQGLVVGLYLRRFEERGRPERWARLAAALSAVTGRLENPRTVKSLYRFGRARLAGLLAADYAELCEGPICGPVSPLSEEARR